MAKKTKHVHINVTSNVSGVAKKATASSDKLGGSLKKAKGQAGGLSAGFKYLGARFLKFAKHPAVLVAGALVAVGKGLKEALRVAEGFSKSMSRLEAISGASGEALEKLDKNAQNLGASTQFTAAQVADAQTELAKMGFTTTGILNATSGALDLAVSSGIEMSEAAEIMASTMNGFGMATAESTRITDVMAKSFVTSALDASKFRESMKMVAPIASAMKVSLEQTTGALGVLANAGISGSMAGTALRRTMQELSAKTGKDFRNSLDIYAERMDNAASTSEKMAIATEAVGMRAAPTLLALANNREKLDELTLAYEQAGGASADMVGKMEDNLSGDKKKMKSALEGLGIAVSRALGLEKAMRGLTKFFTRGISGITNYFETLGARFEIAGNTFKILGKNVSLFFQGFGQKANDLMLTLADVPIIGKAIDKDVVAKNKEVYKQTISDLESELDGLKERQGELRGMIDLVYNPAEDVPLEDDVAPVTQAVDVFVEGEGDASGDDEAKLQRLKDFLNKQTKLVQDHEDETHLAKMERMRERALEEAELLGANQEQLDEIRKGYQDRIDAARQKDVDDSRKAEMEKNAAKVESMQNNLDNMARIMGEETRLGKLSLIAKSQMANIEEKIDGDLTAGKMVKAMAEGAVDYVKGIGKAASSAPFPFNVPIIAGHVATALPLFMQLKKAFKSSKSSAKVSAPSIGGGGANAVAAPSFNVVGQADAGSQMVANAIQSGNNKPIKAFVVSDEVSNQQELERKASTTASLGG